MALAPADIATLSRLLDEALELDIAEREAWLAVLPAEYQRHAPRLREMLEAQNDLARVDRLDALPKLERDDAAVARAGERVGAYSLIREIGRGGMGTVWLAERADGSYQRQVALKLPRLAWGAGLAERMAREREIGMLLEHPNIARLYDAGVDDGGRPFLALEFIDGQPIDAWCEAQGLSVPARLRLFVQVARAVAYAHGRLVVHRDLKPSNVLVAPDGQTHLLDFGIAKLLHEAVPGELGLTQDLGRVLTPHYASPEQMRGEAITVHSDVYSLGVLLYELLTGSTPYQPKRKTLAALEEAVLEGEPAMASSRPRDKATAKVLRGDVDTILAKALCRDPGKRYATADALANDIERHLNGDTVLARPDSTWYRLRKATRRHRVGVAATATVFVSIVAGSGAALVQAQRATRAAERERVVKEFVGDLFRVNTSSNPANAELRKLPVEMLLEHGANLIQTRFPGQPEIQAELYGVVASVFADMRAYRLAIKYSTRQIDALSSLRADDAAQARAIMALALALMNDERLSDAELRARQAVELARNEAALFGKALVLLARVQDARGQVAERDITIREADGVLRRAPGAPSVEAAWLHWLKANAADDANGFGLQLPLRLQAIDIALRAEGTSSKTAAEMSIRLGGVLISLERLPEGLAHIVPALEVLDSLGGADAVRGAVERAEIWQHLHGKHGVSFEEAVSVIRQCRAAIEALGVAVPESVRAKLDFSEGGILFFRGNVADAEPLLRAGIRTVRSTDKRMHSRELFLAAYWGGHLATLSGHHEEADVLLRERIRLRNALVGAGVHAPWALSDYADLAQNQTMQGNFAAAQSILDTAPSFEPPSGDAKGSYWSESIPWEQARLMLRRGEPQAALRAIQGLDDTQDMAVIDPREARRAEALCGEGRPAEGLAVMRKVLEARAPWADAKDPFLARNRAVAGLCALSIGDRQFAMQMAQGSRAAFTAQPGVSSYFKEPLVQLERGLAKQ